MFSAAGRQFGKLTVMMPSDRAPHWWIARCECGGMWEGWKYSLLYGSTRSCGCDWRQPKHGEGLQRTPEYTAWISMRQRCENPRSQGYSRYGGRGVTVCAAWREYQAFLDDVGRRPSPRHSLDRIDNDGNYEPGNVRWATPTEQSQNTCRVTSIAINGETLSVTQWCRRLGISNALYYRRTRQYGWPPAKALTTPSRKGS